MRKLSRTVALVVACGAMTLTAPTLADAQAQIPDPNTGSYLISSPGLGAFLGTNHLANIIRIGDPDSSPGQNCMAYMLNLIELMCDKKFAH